MIFEYKSRQGYDRERDREQACVKMFTEISNKSIFISISGSIGLFTRAKAEFDLRFKTNRIFNDLFSKRKSIIVFIKYSQTLIKCLKSFILIFVQVFASIKGLRLST